MTQTVRLIAFLRAHRGCTIAEITRGMDPFVANPRARISELRQRGYLVECRKGPDGVARYFVFEGRPASLTGEQRNLAL